MKQFSIYLKNCRLKSGLTQAEVAERMGYGSPQFISNMERGVSVMPTKSLKMFVELFDLDPEEVIEKFLEDKKDRLREMLGVSKGES